MVQRLVLPPYSKKAMGSIPGSPGAFRYGVFCSPCVCISSLQVLQIPPTVQKHAHGVNVYDEVIKWLLVQDVTLPSLCDSGKRLRQPPPPLPSHDPECRRKWV